MAGLVWVRYGSHGTVSLSFPLSFFRQSQCCGQVLNFRLPPLPLPSASPQKRRRRRFHPPVSDSSPLFSFFGGVYTAILGTFLCMKKHVVRTGASCVFALNFFGGEHDLCLNPFPLSKWVACGNEHHDSVSTKKYQSDSFSSFFRGTSVTAPSPFFPPT